MALTGLLETSVEIKSPAEKFYNLWKTQIYRLPSISSDYLQSVNVHEGDWHTDGAVKNWSYTLDGKALTLKEKVTFDDQNKTLKYSLLEGDLAKDFKNLTVLVKVIPKADGNGGAVKFTMEFEKMSIDVAAPTSYIAMAGKVFKDVDAHLLSN